MTKKFIDDEWKKKYLLCYNGDEGKILIIIQEFCKNLKIKIKININP
ncbi:hypothetical protein [Clostridium sp. LS]|nr:hypothetical protein [Clostridium sp. LS]